ncbi:MAG: exo-alpha-sialidase [Thermoflexales bacterium]|nr:exo-alpha-sialidase [Thermoflexales bacterium]
MKVHLKFIGWLLAIIGLLTVAAQTFAQADDGLWATPANISRSGAASRPAMAVDANGTRHAVWWDETVGQLYARTTITATTWTAPVRLPNVFGRREVDSTTNRETLAPPRVVRLLTDGDTTVHLFWYDNNSRLLGIRNTTGPWSDSTVLAEAAVAFEVAPDGNGLHLAYIRPTDSATAPAGVYHRTTTATGWGPAVLIAGSAYFRGLQADTAHVSVAGDQADHALVTWDDPRLGQSFLARSSDGGDTWSEPQAIAGTQGNRVQRARVALTPNGAFLLQWQDTGFGTCGFVQQLSTDGGETWSDPQLVLSSLSRCSADWSYQPDGQQRLWLISRASAAQLAAGTSSVTVAAWDGQSWSPPRDVSLTFFDATSQRSVALNCLDVAVSGQTLGVIGCDTGRDIWATRNSADLSNLLPQLDIKWTRPESLMPRTGAAAPADLPDVTADNEGNFVAVWSQVADDQTTSIYAAVAREGRWAAGSLVTASSSTALTNDQRAPKAEQPAVSVDTKQRAHVMWGGGVDGEIYHAWAYVRDIGSGQGWSEATTVSPPGRLARWPDLVIHPQSDDLYVVYALPFNEGRGIYFTRSADGGSTWSAPTVVVDAAAAQWTSVDKPRLAFDAQTNTLHATWLRTSLPGQVTTQAVYSARSTDGGQTWSTAAEVASGTVDWPRLAVPQTGQVYLVWSQTQSQGGVDQRAVLGQYSLDGGQRWSEAKAIRGFERIDGPASLTSDGAGTLYLDGVSAGAGNESVLLHAEGDGQTWGAVETIGLGQIANAGNGATTDLSASTNRLSAVVQLWTLQSNGTGQFAIAATGLQLAARSTVAPLPTFTPLPSPTALAAATPTPTATPRPSAPTNVTAPKSGGIPPLALGGALAAIIVVGAVSVTIYLRRR